MSDKKVAELTIMDITERMLDFSMYGGIADASDCLTGYNDGTIDALTEMRRDMEKMTESEFVAKYEEISIEKGDGIFELDEDDPQIEYIQGYCSTVEDILHFINPSKIYEDMTMLREGIEAQEEFDENFLNEIFDDLN